MSHSPLDPEEDFRTPQRESYENGWVAIHRMLREGGSWSGRERNVCWLNLGAGRFADISGVSGLDFVDDGRAVARCDWDDDGDLDLWLAGRTTPRLRFLRNDVRSAGTFVQFTLTGNGANRDAVGARVELALTGEAVPRIASVRAGEGYLAQSSMRVHFGLPPGSTISGVTVRWPGAPAEEFGAPLAGAHYRLLQGSGEALPVSAKAPSEPLAEGALDGFRSTTRARVVLAARPFVPRAHYLVPNDVGPAQRETLQFGGPVLVQLWAEWCAPCKVELQRFPEARDELAGRVGVLALSVDEPDQRDAAARWLESVGWPYGSGFAEEELIEFFDVVQQAVLERRRRLPLPASFLIDRRGQIAVIYFGEVEPQTVLADLDLLELPPDELRAHASPSSGRWVTPPVAVDLARIEGRLRDRGLGPMADEYANRQIQRVQSSPAKVHYDMGVVRQKQGNVEGAIKSFRRSLAIDPDYVDSQIGLAYLLQSRAQYEPAVELYRKALRREPDNRIALYNVALALAATGRHDAAQVQLGYLREVDAQMGERCAADLERMR